MPKPEHEREIQEAIIMNMVWNLGRNMADAVRAENMGLSRAAKEHADYAECLADKIEAAMKNL